MSPTGSRSSSSYRLNRLHISSANLYADMPNVNHPEIHIMALNADKIALSALDLLNEVGIEGLSTRQLAARLNVQGPALYNHFRNKAQLLDRMATTMLLLAFGELDPGVHWKDWLRGLARASRSSILKYRDGARLLVMSSPNAPLRSQLIPFAAQPLIDAGFDPYVARHALATLASFVEGWTLNEQNDATRALMNLGFADVGAAFDESVEILVAGLVARKGSGGEIC